MHPDYSSFLIDDRNEETLYTSSNNSKSSENKDFILFDDFCEDIIKKEFEKNISFNKYDEKIKYDPQLAKLMKIELGLNCPQDLRRNPWGNLTYREIITKAIENSDQQRLTLSQIYSWIILYVPYFKNKKDKKFIGKWKNCIRHKLSTHHEFVHIPNEIHGKSSWWIIDYQPKIISKRPKLRSNKYSK